MRSSSRPLPRVGDVIRYAYLWSHEQDAGREDGLKDRPCAVVVLVGLPNGETEVVVLPVTSRPPDEADAGVELPAATRRRLGLQAERCWVIVSELNIFRWPGPDLRPTDRGEGSHLYGRLPHQLVMAIRQAFAARRRRHPARTIRRTE